MIDSPVALGCILSSEKGLLNLATLIAPGLVGEPVSAPGSIFGRASSKAVKRNRRGPHRRYASDNLRKTIASAKALFCANRLVLNINYRLGLSLVGHHLPLTPFACPQRIFCTNPPPECLVGTSVGHIRQVHGKQRWCAPCRFVWFETSV